MNFFTTIKNSIYSPEFYSSVPLSSFWKAFRYLLLFFVILAVIQTIIVSLTIGVVQKELNTFLTTAINYYPKELEVTLKNGQVTTNVKEPYFIPLPKGKDWEREKIKNLIVIDTKTPFSAQQFNMYSAGMWITKDAAYYKKNNTKIEAFDLSEIKQDVVINRSLIQMLGDKIRPYLVYVTPILLVVAFIGTLAGFELKLLYLLILALGILLLSKIMKWGLSYAHSYKVGMYAVTLGILVDFLLGALSRVTSVPSIPFLFTIITFLVVFVNLHEVKTSGVVAEPVDETPIKSSAKETKS